MNSIKKFANCIPKYSGGKLIVAVVLMQKFDFIIKQSTVGADGVAPVKEGEYRIRFK